VSAVIVGPCMASLQEFGTDCKYFDLLTYLLVSVQYTTKTYRLKSVMLSMML